MTNAKKASALQWNCRGLRPNYIEIKSLLADHIPSVVCLQETRLKDSDKISFKGYDMYNKTAVSPIDNRAIGGASVLVKRGVPHSVIHLNTNLQAVAVKVTLHRTLTICSIYIPPKYKLRLDEMDNLASQLPTPFLFLGDFNAHSDLWGCVDSNRLGGVVELFLDRSDSCFLNDGSITYIHPATGSPSAIDLSLCSPSIFMDFLWRVHDDQCGSDHYPIFLDISKPMPEERIPRWQLEKANWAEFRALCSEALNKDDFDGGHDPVSSFTNTLIDIATKTIPKSSARAYSKHKPWFNAECKEAVASRKKALQTFKNQPTSRNLRKYQKVRAKTRRIIKKSKQDSWRQYVSKLNSRTSVKEAWDMVRKISGKQVNSSTSHLNKSDGTKCTETHDIANLLADEFEHNSSSNHYSPKFQRFKNNTEKYKLDFSSDNTEDYNRTFNITELKDSLSRCHDTATGPDEVHYQFLKHLPKESLELLLDIFNRIWESGSFPEAWREATIIPIAKPGKDATNPTNYRPISLTSCLCKTLERMINARLVWFLESNGLISKYQSGFRHGRSTSDQLVRLESFIRDGFVRGQHVVSVFFDLDGL